MTDVKYWQLDLVDPISVLFYREILRTEMNHDCCVCEVGKVRKIS